MFYRIIKSLFIASIICITSTSTKSTFAAQTTAIVQQSKALQPIIISASASDDTKKLAETFAAYLHKISGANFDIKTGDGKTGIAVGTVADFPELPFKSTFDPSDLTKREDYLLRSHVNGVYLIGATNLGVSHAVWDFLYRLGYRQYFPGKAWEVFPNLSDINVSLDAKEEPDFYDRRIWYGYGSWPGQKNLAQDKVDWDAHNRMASGLKINNGHAYDGIIRANKSAFEAHPEYLTKPGGNKFCVSNPGLQQLVVDYALSYFEKNPQADSISMDPSDGGGWESNSCPDVKVYPSISDRVVTLANLVAQAVNKKFPGKYVGIYAYSHHSAPPTIKVDPHVMVGVATAFSAGFDNIAPGWKKQGATIGVREYYSVSTWDKSMPGKGSASNPAGIAKAIRDQYQMGARFLSAESSDSWGPSGLAYYVASRLLWDHTEDENAIIDDFFEKAFGPAPQPMRHFYQLIDGANKPLISADLVGRMYRDIDAARKLTSDSAIRARLNDLALYTRYVDLAQSMHDQKGAEETLAFAYRSRGAHMEHSYGLWRDIRGWPLKIDKDSDIFWKVPEGKNPLKGSAPFTDAEIEKIIADGIASNPLIPFQTVKYSNELIPATALKLTTPGKTGAYSYVRSAHHFYFWVDDPSKKLELTFIGGYVGTIEMDRKTTLKLSAADDPASQTLMTVEVPNDRQPHEVEIKTTFKGLHRMDVNSMRKAVHISWPDGTPVTFASSLDEPITLAHRINMYFYVPKGTKVVGGYAQGVGNILNSDGKKVFEFTKDKFNHGNYFSVPVAAGQDGKLWQFSSSAGPRYLMTVPPYLARSAEELMLPKEVVEADTKS